MQRLANNELKFASRLEHIWWGATVENKRYGVPRIDALRNCDVAMRFLSCEPLLEHLGPVNLDGINWVIAGGESGPGARPMAKEWVLSLQTQCNAANVPFFFKQWGGFPKAKYGGLLDGKEYKDAPLTPSAFVPTLRQRQGMQAALSNSFSTLGIPQFS